MVGVIFCVLMTHHVLRHGPILLFELRAAQQICFFLSIYFFKFHQMEKLFEETWGTGLFQYRTLFINIFGLISMEVIIQSYFHLSHIFKTTLTFKSKHFRKKKNKNPRSFANPIYDLLTPYENFDKIPTT